MEYSSGRICDSHLGAWAGLIMKAVLLNLVDECTHRWVGAVIKFNRLFFTSLFSFISFHVFGYGVLSPCTFMSVVL